MPALQLHGLTGPMDFHQLTSDEGYAQCNDVGQERIAPKTNFLENVPQEILMPPLPLTLLAERPGS
jgi:hypothetical protein